MTMDKTTNVLSMFAQDKMRRSMPENVMAQAEVDYMQQNPNYLKERYTMDTNKRKVQFAADLLAWATKSLNYIDPAEYPQFRQTAISYGMNPSLLPEGFQTPEEFETFKMKTSMGLPEFQKLMQGKPVTMSRVNKNGTIQTVEATNNEDIASFAQQGYELGKITGTATRPEKPQYEHKPVYNSAGKITGYKSIEKGKDFTFDEGEFGNAPDASKSTEPTPQQAYKRISDIQKARATLDKSSKITQMLAALNPEFRSMVGQQITPDLKQQLNDAWDNEIAYLQQFTTSKPKDSTPEPAAMAEMPDAAANKDKVIRDTTTGKRYKSDGQKWIEVQ